MNIRASIVSILNPSGKIVGTGFLSSDNLVVTCAHVAALATGYIDGNMVQVRFDGRTEKINALIVSEYWRDVDKGDVAVLRLENVPDGIEPLHLGNAAGSAGHDFYAYGYATVTDVQGIGARGQIIDNVNNGRLVQLTSQEPDHGMSGGPVWDEQRRVVIGMVTKGKGVIGEDQSLRNIFTTFATTVEVIREACPELRLTEICPYRSLDAFTEADASFFFGRDKVIQKLVDSLKREPRFLAVLGPSGSGKSSVVQAGLIPLLRLGKVSGSRKWGIITTRPANQPFLQLAGAGLQGCQDGLVNAVNKWLSDNPDKTHLLLVIDQFEEVMTSTSNELGRKFVSELAQLLDNVADISIVITLRDDFYSRFLKDFPILTAWLERGLVNIPQTLDRDDLRAMIARPAGSVGLKFDDGLIDVIIADACRADYSENAARSTILPLLEFALTQLWEEREDGQLTHEAYQTNGGTTGSLTQWASKSYARLSTSEKKLAEDIFCKLVHLGDEKEKIPDVRRVISIIELGTLGKKEDIEQVKSKLVQARLLSVYNETGTGQQYIEIIHDALLREWAVLEQWIDKYRRREELARERRRILIIAGLTVGLIVMIALAIFAWRQRNDAVYQAQIALSRQLVAQAESTNALRSSKQMIAVLLATYSMKIYPSSEASQILLGNTNAQTVAITSHDAQIVSVAFSKDGKHVVSGGGDTVIVFDVESGQEIARRKHDDLVYTAVFSPDGKFIVSGGKDRKACVWEIETEKDIHCFSKDDNPYLIIFSPDGRYFSAAGEEFIHVWDTSTSALVNKIRDNKGPIKSLIFSHDGNWIVAGDMVNAHVWDIASGKEIARLKNGGQVNSVAIDPTGKYVVTGGEDFSVRIWDIATEKEYLNMAHAGPVTSVAFSPDGKFMASGSRDNTIRLWNLSTGGEIMRMNHDNSVFMIAFSPSGNHIVSASSDKTARVWETGTGREVARMTHDELVYVVTFSSDGQYVASGGYDHIVRVWRTKTSAEVARMTHNGKVYSVSFSPDRKLAASGGSDNTVRIWNVLTDTEIFRVEHTGDVFSLAFSKDGTQLVSGGGETVVVSEVETGKEMMRVEHADDVYSVAFSPDGMYIAAGGSDFTACVWRVATDTNKPQACMLHEGKVRSVAFSPDGKYVISGSDDRTARIWDRQTGEEILRLTHDTEVFSTAYSPDGKFVVSGDTKFAILWDAQSGKKISQVTHNIFVYAVAFSADGRYIVSGGGRVVKIWSAPGGEEIVSLPHDGIVNWVTFSPDGKYVASGDDFSARVWDAMTGKEIARMTHGNLVKTVAFSPDGKYVISGGVDRTARVWLWEPADLISNTCASLPRNLTISEWEQYLEDEPYQVICPNLDSDLQPTPTP